MGTSHADAAFDVPLPPADAPSADKTGQFDSAALADSEPRPQPREIAGVPVTVLTTDTQLWESIRAAVRDDHPLFIAQRLADAAQFAASGRCPILITDQALDSAELARITSQLRTHEPALVVIAVGNRGQVDALKDLVSSRAVDRFMLKPVTPTLTRLVIESVAREYRWRNAHTRVGDGASPPESPPRMPGVQAQASRRPDALAVRSGRKILRSAAAFTRPSWILVAVVAAVVAAAVWWIMFQRLPDIDPREVITRNLVAGQQAFDTGRYLDPPESSALHYYSAVLALDPANADAKAGIDGIADHFAGNATQLIAAGRFAEALAALESVRRVRPGHQGLPALEAQLRKALETQMLSARQATDIPDPPLSGQPAAPPARQSAPDGTADQRLVRESRERILLEAYEAIALGQFDAARQLIAEAEAAGVPVAELAALSSARILALEKAQQNLAKDTVETSLETSLSNARAASVAPVPEAASAESMPAEPPFAEAKPAEPKLARLVQPEYPSEARLRGIEGWVDLSLGVSAAGDVIDPRIESSSMKHLFGRAALTAVKQWKYEPRAAADVDSAQRVKVRVQFQLDN